MAKRGPYAISRWRELTFLIPNTTPTVYNLTYSLGDRSAGETFEREFIHGRAKLDLSGAYLSGARLRGADLAHDNLASIDLTNADLRGANLSGASLNSAFLSRSNLTRANLEQAVMPGAALNRAHLAGACLKRADLRGADLSFADLSSADLAEANLAGAELREANLALADLSGACLTDARLTATQLAVANLAGADLRRASLVRPRLQATILSGAVLEMTLFADCDLSQSLGLESVRHLGPSIIGMDTFARSGGKIPGGFLRLAGVAEELISTQGQPVIGRQTRSKILLVSSVTDSEFAACLEADLRAASLACWSLAVDDEAAFGDDERESLLGRFIYYDRLVLICSEASLGSPYGWRSFDQVARERGGSGQLSAVNLDQRLFDEQDSLCVELVKGKVLDFRNWRQPAAYREAVASLVATLTEPEEVGGLREPPDFMAPPGD